MADNTYEILMDCFTGNTLNTTEAPDNTYEVFRAVHDVVNSSLRVNVTNIGGSLSPIIGTHNPETTEYPDGYSGYTSGVWAIAGMVSEPFTYTTGALAGQDVSNGNGIVWDGISWSIIADANESIVQPSFPDLFEQGVIIPSGLSTSAIRSKYNASTGGNAGKAGSIAVGINTKTTGTGSAAFGKDNVAGGSYSFVAGNDNVASGNYSFAGGSGIVADGICSFNHSFADRETPTIESDYSAILGGTDNNILDTSDFSFIGGGGNNLINNSSEFSFIGGGGGNEISGSSYSFINGGSVITVSSSYRSGILGGTHNTVNNGLNSVIIGGANNTCSGENSIILGGTYQNGTQDDMVYVPAVTFKSGIAPTAPTKGTMYFDGGSNQFMGYNGSTWVVLG